jgi:basic amino acid/polyamine antiporter, APA family
VVTNPSSTQSAVAAPSATPLRQLGFFDCTMIVMGAMIGSGIFIVPAAMACVIQSPGGLLLAWLLTGVLTVGAAISYGELSSALPEAGGMYRYLREAFSPLTGFLYGWTFFTVIQTGTIAAVAVAFARFTGVLFPWFSESHYLLGPFRFTAHYAISLSTSQLLGVVVILVLTVTNAFGLRYGKWVQNVLTVVKLGSLAAVILVGLTLGINRTAVHDNFTHMFQFHGLPQPDNLFSSVPILAMLIAICVSQSGSLFSADSWHNVAFTSEEVRDPRRVLPRALILGSSLVVLIYFVTNVVYLTNLTFAGLETAPHDRVATAMLERVFPSYGSTIMAVAVMISTFGCDNSLVLSGARAYYAMARDGLFFRSVSKLNKFTVPGRSLNLQAAWSILLVLFTTYSAKTGYGNLYSDLLDYVISAALLFYILTIAGVMVLRRKRPGMDRPYRTWGYPLTPILYILGASAILLCLGIYRPATTWPGFAIVACGIPVYFLFQRRAKTVD